MSNINDKAFIQTLNGMNRQKLDDLLKQIRNANPKEQQSVIAKENLTAPLIYAILYFSEAVETLLNTGVDINSRNGIKLSPFMAAALYRPEVLKEILRLRKNDIQFKLPDKEQDIMHLVASHGVVKSARYLIQAGADVNVPDCKGSTPLHYAAYNGQIYMITLLLNNGALLNKQNAFGSTPFHYAVKRGDLEICKQLWEFGADKSIKNSDGLTPIGLYKKLTKKDLPIAEWKAEKSQKLLHFRKLCIVHNEPR